MRRPVRNNTLYYRVRYRKRRDCRASILYRPRILKGDRAAFSRDTLQKSNVLINVFKDIVIDKMASKLRH